MAEWDELWRELDVWRRNGRTASFWWRDDDATRATPELEHLLAIGERSQVPVSLAVIPRDANGSLESLVAGRSLVSVMQHGWSHENHAPHDEKQEEFGPHRSPETMLAELSEGQKRLHVFENALPVLVAPWNRMDDALMAHLPAAGLRGVSTMGPRANAEAVPGVRQTNVHVDIVDWHGTGGFIGDCGVLDQVLTHLVGRRSGNHDPDEPTGLMTHHLFHDEGCWTFVERFISETTARTEVRWLGGSESFWP